jgi:hypothetical protein
MANLTKEERERRLAEKEAKVRSELEEKIRKEYEAKLNVTSVSHEEVKKNHTKKKTKIPLDILVPVKSGVQGILVYGSRKTIGYQIEWDSYGSIEYVELGELLSMRNTNRSFYKNNWIFFEDTDEYTAVEIYEFLDVAQYYQNTIIGEDIETIFTKSLDDIRKIITPLSKGVKDTIATKARLMIDSGEFDSINRIQLLEELLDVELKPSY